MATLVPIPTPVRAVAYTIGPVLSVGGVAVVEYLSTEGMIDTPLRVLLMALCGAIVIAMGTLARANLTLPDDDSTAPAPSTVASATVSVTPDPAPDPVPAEPAGDTEPAEATS